MAAKAFRSHRRILAASTALSAFAASTAEAADISFVAAALDPVTAVAAGAVSLAIAAAIWSVRISAGARKAAAKWGGRLAEMEAKLEKSESVLSAHPGLVIVWDDESTAIADGWGRPRILGGPAALASLLTFVDSDKVTSDNPVERLLESVGDLPVEEEIAAPDGAQKLKDKVAALRRNGVAFSGGIVTSEGRTIEADGRAAGGQAALWLVDPAARSADESGVLGHVRERAADLHGALSLLDRAPFPAWRRGADLKLQWVNAAYADMVEAASPAETISKQIELDAGVPSLAKTAQSSRAAAEERRPIVVKGDRRAFRIVETPLHGAGEAASGGVAIDVTDIEKTETALRRHIDAHNKTLNHIPSGVAIFGPSTDLMYYNRAFAQLWRLEDGDLRSKPSHGEILDKLREKNALPEQADYLTWKETQLSLYTDVADGAAAQSGAAPDEMWPLPDGRTLKVKRERHPFGGVLVLFQDITDELHLKTRYNTLISVQNATLNNLSEGVAVFGSDGVLQLFNSAFQGLWDLSPDLLARQPHLDDIAAIVRKRIDEGGRHWNAIAERVTSLSPDHRKPITGEEMALKDGRLYSYMSEPLPDGATLLSFLDVTDSKMREKALEERNIALEEADKIKSAFVNHVSYQLRTPLNTIIGFSEMLEHEMFGALNDKQKEYAGGILSASNQLLDLINDIIDLATIEAGKMALDVGPVDVRAALESAVTLAALKAEDTRIALRLECPKDIGVIDADERRLKQALFNLLSNAFAFTGAGGQVVLGAERKSGALRIWVSDTGRGIAAREQARAFDRFEGKGQGAGAGLGLSLVRSFIELHGGWVDLRSTTDVGTTVTCHLPEAATMRKDPDGDAPAPPPPASTQAPRASMPPAAE
ncbi:MAG: PAS-domain containing protein [Pseudomonadota bacterium]